MSSKNFNAKQWHADTLRYIITGKTSTKDINTTGYQTHMSGAYDPVSVKKYKNNFSTKTIEKMKKRKFKKASGLKNRVKKLEKKVKSIEKKYRPTIGTTALTTAGTLVPLSNMAQGDQAINREGIKITLDQLYGKFLLTGNTIKDTGPSVVRLIILYDKEMHGTYPTTLNILETANVLSQFNHVNRQRFRIIYDHVMTVGNDVDAYGYTHVWKYRSKLKGEVSYLGTSDTEGSQGANNIYMLVLTNEATNPPSIAYNLMLRYWG